VGDGFAHGDPEVGAGAFGHAGAASGVGEVLAGGAAGEDVDGLDLGPVDGGDVADVGDAGETVLEDLEGALVDLAVPGEVGVDDLLDAHAEAAVAGEELADAWLHPAPSPPRTSPARWLYGCSTGPLA
jgi:hypothetical protein